MREQEEAILRQRQREEEEEAKLQKHLRLEAEISKGWLTGRGEEEEEEGRQAEGDIRDFPDYEGTSEFRAFA